MRLLLYFSFTFILICPLFIYAEDNSSDNIISKLRYSGNHSLLVELIENSAFKEVFKSISGSKRTFYAPTDTAFKKLDPSILDRIYKDDQKIITKLLLMHVFSGNNIENIKSDVGNTKLTLDGALVFLYENSDLYVKDIVTKGKPIFMNYTTIIPVECFMFLQSSTKDKSLDLKIQNKFPLTTCCLENDLEVSAFLGK